MSRVWLDTDHAADRAPYRSGVVGVLPPLRSQVRRRKEDAVRARGEDRGEDIHRRLADMGGRPGPEVRGR